mmetsp:Transcript_5155/g.9013  ORF Transcript_5155/g.9013 Transcript_5155/m.9013 type:complete len:84 (+) Transcript_5155:738-989(+)
MRVTERREVRAEASIAGNARAKMRIPEETRVSASCGQNASQPLRQNEAAARLRLRVGSVSVAVIGEEFDGDCSESARMVRDER